MSRDPFDGWMSSPASQHGYSYVHNNPVNHIDPSGRCIDPITGLACLTAGAIYVGVGALAGGYAVHQGYIDFNIPYSFADLREDLQPLNVLDDIERAIAVCRTAVDRSSGGVLDQAREHVNTNTEPLVTARPQGRPQPQGTPLPPDVSVTPSPDQARMYVTYIKKHPNGLVYSGRASGIIDKSKPWEPQARQIVRNRDSSHHMWQHGYGQAELDQHAVGNAINYVNRYNDQAYLAIRGREQQLIDFHGFERFSGSITDYNGGAWSDSSLPHLTGNSNRGVAKDNVNGLTFHNAANAEFGQLFQYTGH